MSHYKRKKKYSFFSFTCVKFGVIDHKSNYLHVCTSHVVLPIGYIFSTEILSLNFSNGCKIGREITFLCDFSVLLFPSYSFNFPHFIRVPFHRRISPLCRSPHPPQLVPNLNILSISSHPHSPTPTTTISFARYATLIR